MRAILSIAFLITAAPLLTANPVNLLRNPGFEETLGKAWHKRTPDAPGRRIVRDTSMAHSGNAALLIENGDGIRSRVRQGHDKSITPKDGDVIELSAWVRQAPGNVGDVKIQFYGMDAKGGITTQPVYSVRKGAGEWDHVHFLLDVPPKTAYCMAYLELDGEGRAWFDDVSLAIVEHAAPPPPRPRIAVFTDLADNDACLQNVKRLLGNGYHGIEPGTPIPADIKGGLVLYRDAKLAAEVAGTIAKLAAARKPVFMDLANFATVRKLNTHRVAPAKPGKSVQDRMEHGVTVVQESPVVSGAQKGQTVPRLGSDGKLLCLAPASLPQEIKVLGIAADGSPALVQAGAIVAADMLSLNEPHWRDVGSYYKYLFMTNHLTNRVRFGELFPARWAYAELVNYMRRLAAEFPTQITLKDEGEGCGGLHMYTLNLGTAGKPTYFFYAAAHGSEWEPGYGLITFARRLAEGQLSDVVDLSQVHVKILPIVNPWGYDNFTRKNANGIDLNRQGDCAWANYRTRQLKEGTYGPDAHDWRGTNGPFTEPEAKVFKTIIDACKPWCTLDFHGNASATNNKLGIIPITAAPGNELHCRKLKANVNARLGGRFVLHQNDEETPSEYLIDHLHPGTYRPVLTASSARGRYGICIELTAGYRSSYGTILQTDVTCEIARAMFTSFPRPR